VPFAPPTTLLDHPFIITGLVMLVVVAGGHVFFALKDKLERRAEVRRRLIIPDLPGVNFPEAT